MRVIRVLIAAIAVIATAAAAVVLLAGSGGVDLGTLWHGIAPGSLNLVQAVTQRYLHPALWTHVILPALLMPAAGVFAATAVVAILSLSATLLWRRRKTK